jgi:hypothetical protein
MPAYPRKVMAHEVSFDPLSFHESLKHISSPEREVKDVRVCLLMMAVNSDWYPRYSSCY